MFDFNISVSESTLKKSFTANFPGSEMKKGTKLTIRFGELIPFEKLGFTEEGSREELKNAANYVMDEIVKLWEMGHCE